MKPRAFKPFSMASLGLWAAVSLAVATALAGDDPSTPAADTPAASPTPKVKKHKGPKDTADPTLPPKVRKAKDIPFPIPQGKPAHDVTIPSYDLKGNVTSLIQALVMTPVDKEHVQMEQTKFKLNSPDGKDNYEIELPLSVLNLKTNVVSSDHPVVVRTKDFELTGEQMEFNTVERAGELRGHVHMRIHNLKQTIGPGGETPAFK